MGEFGFGLFFDSLLEGLEFIPTSGKLVEHPFNLLSTWGTSGPRRYREIEGDRGRYREIGGDMGRSRLLEGRGGELGVRGVLEREERFPRQDRRAEALVAETLSRN